MGLVAKDGGHDFKCSAFPCVNSRSQQGQITLKPKMESEGTGEEPQLPTESEGKGHGNGRRKRIRQQGSQMDDKMVSEEQAQHGCTTCNSKLDSIQEKLDKCC